MTRISALFLCLILAVVAIYASPAERGRQGSLSESRGQEIEEQARRNHGAVINELKEKFKNFKENCFPMPKGCRCVERGPRNEEVVKRIYNEAECRVPQNARTGGS